MVVNFIAGAPMPLVSSVWGTLVVHCLSHLYARYVQLAFMKLLVTPVIVLTKSSLMNQPTWFYIILSHFL